MLKAQITPIDQSNIANYGSSLHVEARESAAHSEEEWSNAGKEPGLQIWRIEKFAVKPWAKNMYGQLFSGDSYILLHTQQTPKSDKLFWDLYFWIGRDSSQDEYGTCAYKTVELDDHLHGAPVQHREVQGRESDAFLNLFNGRIQLLDGGIDSAFNTVKPQEYKPRLLHLKGKRAVRVSQVPLSTSSLNEGDVFILDAGLRIFQWMGKSAGAFEKRKATEVIAEIRESRHGKPKLEVFESGDETEDFWQTLGGKGPVSSAIPDNPSSTANLKKLFIVSDAAGSMKVEKLGETTECFSRTLLNDNDVFILDTEVQIIVWVGKGANNDERKHSLVKAVDFLKNSGRPDTTPIIRIIQGGEINAWNNAFTN